MFEISCHRISEDFLMFRSVINQGIDSRLEAFTESDFTTADMRLYMNFSDSELSVLLRRLLELEDDHADQWVDDIVEAKYGEVVR